MGPMHAQYRAYAPEPFLVGQARGPSDISGARNPTKFWSPPASDLGLVLVRGPQAVIAELRSYGLHTGFDRDPETDYDRGLVNAFASLDPVPYLGSWIETILWEVASDEGLVAAVWHPRATLSLLQGVTGRPVRELDVPSVEAGLRLIPGLRRRVIPARTHVILLRAPNPVVAELRGHGWHTGYWRDPATDRDRGLDQLVPLGTPGAKLREWVEAISREAEAIRGGVTTVWHPQVDRALLESATDRRVVEIRADTVASALEQWERHRPTEDS